MQVDFFKTSCIPSETNVELFGIHDETNNNVPAYLVFDEFKSWMLTIQNNKNKIVVFYPIDNCLKIFKPETRNKESLCDGFFIYEDNICFVELAESKHKSPQECIDQLISTLTFFNTYHSAEQYSKKYALVSNIRKITSSISTERQENFKFNTGYNLIIKTKIEI